MLNKNGQRELAYLVTVDEIKPIPNYDRVEYARTNGWWCVVKKDQFKVGDIAIYFEVDSQVPATEEFAFLESKKYKIKTQRMCKVLSQGLLMHPLDFNGWTVVTPIGGEPTIKTDKGIELHLGDGVTEILGVTYADAADNARKANVIADPNQKYKAMAQRHAKLFKKPIFRKLMKTSWGRKILFVFFGKKRDKIPTHFPTHFEYIHKTDEERVENMPFVLKDKRKLIASEKLDGTSSTYILERKPFNKFEFYVLSRNVRQLTPEQECYHDDNIYWEMAFKYDIENHLKQYLKDNPELKYVCVQGESVGNVQGNPLKLNENDFYGFNFIRSDVGRISSLEGREILKNWGMKWVPILSTEWVNPDTMEEMKALADGKSVVNPAVLREGIVYRDPNDGSFSFKNVSNKFLEKKKA